MKRLVLGSVIMLASAFALADGRSACEAGDGAYRSGTIVNGPRFSHGQYRQGVELSHTHLSLRADQDARVYDVAIDNVFANGYDARQGGVPSPISSLRVGERLEVCGVLYDRGVGIHFVHASCGRPNANHPDGWIRQPGGANLEANTAYCDLFQGRRRRR
jgi:hypothetical protein